MLIIIIIIANRARESEGKVGIPNQIPASPPDFLKNIYL